MNKTVYFILGLFICIICTARSQTTKNLVNTPPALSSITIQDLKRDLYGMADPHFNGRSAGTLDELKACTWFADRMREAGLDPGGDDGTYFQFFSLVRNRVSTSSTLSIGDHKLELWKDALIAQIAPGAITAPIVFLGEAGKYNLDKINIKGKAVAIQVIPDGINRNVSLPEWRYNRAVMTKYGNDILARGAVAIIFIADKFGEHSWPYAKENLVRGLYDIEGGPNAILPAKPPVVWLHQSAAEWIKKEGLVFTANLVMETFPYPSVNVVGKVKGADPVLSNEYVLLSGHPDAHGIRNVIGNDSIYHGADDNASVNVAVLAVAKALKKSPGKRSALLVIHGAEERGLLGSRWYSAHPTVPLASIVAVLNGDMIGRNAPDSAAVLGIQPPHRNSAELASMALEANREGPGFKLDTLWDKPAHVEGWYFRSDHLPYARLGIPALMYTTLLHPDYHTPQDNAQNIDYEKLEKMAVWIYRTAWKVVNAPKRPATDADFRLER
jgi:hypothetical protein